MSDVADTSSPEALCIFEDDRYLNFFPLSLNKPVFALMVGTLHLWERIYGEIGSERLSLICRPYLADVLKETLETVYPDKEIDVNGIQEGNVLFINGRLLAYEDELPLLREEIKLNTVIDKNGVPVIAFLDQERAASFFEYLEKPLQDSEVLKVFEKLSVLKNEEVDKDLPGAEELIVIKEAELAEWAGSNKVNREKTGLKLLSFYWQLIAENGNCLRDDFQKYPMRGAAPESELFKGVDLINEDDIVIGSGVEVRSGTVLDATEGPVMIADGVKIEPNVLINGPCYIGEGSIVRGGAKIGNCTSLGMQCRVGGEVGESIISAYSNKQHEGFLGHSYIGSWVNIGAGSCNSDLKNNYGKIRAWSSGKIRETGRRFLGLIVGDHSKIAINTSINTGSVVGFCSNAMAVGFLPKFTPSFTWKTEPEFEGHLLDKAVKTAEIMMDRRNVKFTPAMAELFKVINRFSRQSGYNA
ncbi:MAG: hypothetical protein JW746_04730 [Candidatus Krumholzibacteriota bacterium]|nr:hypothetical protein [Candidatus Krumholzibacteriota bacterium]